MMSWAHTEEFLLQQAADDLSAGLDVRPCLVAYDGDDALFVAFLRSFAKGAYADPVIELLALAGPLGADRLALSVGARAWSLDDPIPPVLDGEGDLRQRVVCITRAEAVAGAAEASCSMHPFTVESGTVAWAPVLREPGGVGWLPEALALAVEHRGAMRASRAQIRRQARRCVALGHLLALGDAGAERLERQRSARR